MSSDFQDEIQCLGIEASPSFVRQPEGNGVAERFI
jgi:putative transposase